MIPNILNTTQNEDVMGFLNEIQLDYPDAISLASGRPDETFFDLQKTQDYINAFIRYKSKKENQSPDRVLKSLGQYNRTKGFINELASKYLLEEYRIEANPEDILVNVGTQESFILALLTICNKDEDVIIVENPCYVGISHFGLLGGYNMIPSKVTSNGICLAMLESKILDLNKEGKKVKLVYASPDFQNPTGTRMPIEKRIKLLELAERYDFLIIEDNAYGDFVLNGDKLPTLKSMDQNGMVIYLHSFSKIIYPSLRIGLMVCDKIFENGLRLSDLLAKTKGYTTVNTPGLTQMVLGGMFIEYAFSFSKYNENKLKKLRIKRDKVLKALEKNVKYNKKYDLSSITWNKPEGGYFLTLTLPFEIYKEDIIECARDYGVIVTPMSFFYLNGEEKGQIRLAYSYLQEHKIDTAIKRLSEYLIKKLRL